MRWRTKDGRVLAPRDMSTEHIKNALAMLRRQGWCSNEDFLDSICAASSLNGEMAQYYAEQEVYDMRPHPAIDAFLRELNRRGEGEKH